MIVGKCSPKLSGHKRKKSQPLSEMPGKSLALRSALTGAESKDLDHSDSGDAIQSFRPREPENSYFPAVRV